MLIWAGISGYLFEDKPAPYNPGKGLQNFLESGPPPVYFMLQGDSLESPGILANAIQDAILKRGFRVILSPGCRDLCPISNHPNVCLAESNSHGQYRRRIHTDLN